MNPIEDHLRNSLLDASTHLELRQGLAAQTWTRGRRRRRRVQLAGASTVLLAAAGATLLIGSSQDRGRQVVTFAATASPSAAPTDRAVPNVADDPTVDPVLSAITLPDPAPRYPVRKWKDATPLIGIGPVTSVRSRSFGVMKTPYRVEGTGRFPTGPEVSIYITRAATPLEVHGQISGTTTVRGVTATVLRDGPATEIHAVVGDFYVLAYGNGTDAEMVALLDSLAGLPG